MGNARSNFDSIDAELNEAKKAVSQEHTYILNDTLVLETDLLEARWVEERLVGALTRRTGRRMRLSGPGGEHVSLYRHSIIDYSLDKIKGLL